MRGDWIGIIEAAYELGRDDEQWLQGVAEAVRPAMDRGHGVVGYFFDASAPLLQLHGFVGAGASPAEIDFARRVHDSPIWRSSAMLKETYRSASTIRYAATMGRKRWRALQTVAGFPESGDILIFNIADPSHIGCVFGAPDLAPERSLLARRAPWSRVAAHIAAGLRLRRRLAASVDRASPPEAILSPAGSVVHAEGPAKARSARDVLRDAAVAVERARGPLRRSDPDAAAELWRGMVDGRWSLVDRFDRDGRRFIVAHRNDLSGGPRALTARERQVVSYAAFAHTNKLIAYELGLSVSAVGTYIGSALAKLGLASRVELLNLASTDGAGRSKRA